MNVVRTRRAAAFAAFAASATLVLSGCATGFSAQTNKIYQAGVGANYRTGRTFDVLNTLFVVNTDSTATFSAGVINQTGKPQQLTGITVVSASGTTLAVTAPKEPVTLGEDDLVSLGKTGTQATYTVPTGVTAGDYVTVTLSFSDGAPITIQAPAVTRTADYDDVVGS